MRRYLLLLNLLRIFVVASLALATLNLHTTTPTKAQEISAHDSQSPAPPTRESLSDWEIIQVLVQAAIVIGIAIYLFLSGQQAKALRGLVEKLTQDTAMLDLTQRQYSRLPAQIQHRLAQIIDVLDPLTDTTATDLDDEIIDWLHKAIRKPGPEPTPEEQKK